MQPVAHLTPHLTPRLVRFTAALLAADLLLIGVYGAFRTARALGRRGASWGWRWEIDADHSYAELLGYAKLALLVAALASIGGRRARPVYPALALIFGVALMDDALRAHERLGGWLVEALSLQPFAGLRPQDYGELLAWAGLGLVPLAAVAAGFLRSPRPDRRNAVLLLAGFGLLAAFAVVADMAHMTAMDTFRGANTLFTIIEDGGEQIALSLVCLLALLIRREVRVRPGVGDTAAHPGGRTRAGR